MSVDTRSTNYFAVAVFAVAAYALSPLVGAGEDSLAHAHENLGKVSFPVTCKAEVQGDFEQAVAMLHSFMYDDARRKFTTIAERDPACAMANWGVAMSFYHPLWPAPNAEELNRGREAAQRAAASGASTDREQAYVEAINTFYSDADRRSHRERAEAYRQAMEQLSARYIDDREAAIFSALGILGAAPPVDPTYSEQKRAAAILNRLLPELPDHPGIAHYMIHAFDYPELARLALPAAEHYASVAPASAHALHMPSHIFTRLGLWQKSIDSNLDSNRAAREQLAMTRPGATSFESLHALDYLEYAYLQTCQDEAAGQVLKEVLAAQTFDEPNFAAGYAVAAVPARHALELKRWDVAAKLELSPASLHWDRYRYAEANTHFARAVGAARTANLESARSAVQKLAEIHSSLAAAPAAGPYDWVTLVESLQLAASGWVARSEGSNDVAVHLLRRAAELEDLAGKHPVTPGAILPAREQLGDLLVELDRPREALTEYDKVLATSPGRFNALAGAGHAAAMTDERQRARGYFEQLVGECGDNGGERPALREAKAYLAER